MVFIDFLGFTVRLAADGECVETVARDWLSRFLATYLPGVTVQDTGRGWSGYKNRLDLVGAGLVAFGGNGDTVHVELTGDGCGRVTTWGGLADYLDEADARLTRTDIAYDDVTGRDWNVEAVAKAYQEGGFKPARGISPKAKFIDDCGSGDGCTFYVGSRTSGKIFRGYEKGRQLGDPASPWFRLEVEWRDTHRDLSTAMLRDPRAYLAGAYPAFRGFLASNEEPEIIRTRQFSAAASIEKALDHAKKQAGRLLYALAEVCRMDAGDNYLTDAHIIASARKCLTPEIPKRLAGALHALTLPKAKSEVPAWYREPTEQDEARYRKAFKLEFDFWRKTGGEMPIEVCDLALSPAHAARNFIPGPMRRQRMAAGLLNAA